MHRRAEDLQGQPAAAARGRRLVAAAALISAGTAHADPITFSGYAQIDAIPWSADSLDELDPETGAPLNQERFAIPRARLRAESYRDAIAGAIELDGNTLGGTGTARLLAAHAAYRWRREDLELVASAGLVKIPFGSEVPTAERTKPFYEPPAFARALFPGNHDAGALLAGSYGAARWVVAAMNGAPVGDVQWRGADPASSFELVGRAGLAIAGPRELHIEAGVSALAGRGLSAGTPPTKDELQWLDENQDGLVQPTELQVVPGGPGVASQTYARDALGFDLRVRWCLCALGDGTAFVEGVLATNLDRSLIVSDPIRANRDLRQAGLALGVVQDLGAHARIGVRYDRYDADRDAFEQRGVDVVGAAPVFSTVGVMASARLGDAQLLAQYDHERNPFGRGDDGAPRTRAASRLALRLQVGF